ncbi:uracil-DNA glycosylase [bacterium]|nr:uracil-DNA glycosylase [bacterium]MBU1983559.1 uracil-DNA glycosylase [bacterium]
MFCLTFAGRAFRRGRNGAITNVSLREARDLTRNYFRNLELFEDSLLLPPSERLAPERTVLPGAADPLPPDLDSFHQAIHDCTRCPLGHTRTKFVFGVGNPRAPIVFVGEAPGRDEDLQGIPFVGRAGQLLDQMLADVGLDRRHVYICNVLKCRPPGNRDPEPLEIETCRPYLMTQISIIAPCILVCLGRHAATVLLGIEAPMKDLRGRVIPWQGMKVLVTYHPAYYLRNMSQRRFGDQDFQLMRKMYDEMIA